MEKKNPLPQKNKEYEIPIHALGSNGEGVGKIDGFAVFVEGALPEERALVRMIKVKKSYGVGKLLKVLEPSKNRVIPRCPVAKQCGGCQLQHLSYEGQLAYKTQKVQDDLERIGGLQGIFVPPALGMKEPWHYRNKAQFPVRSEKDSVKVGFYAKRSHRVVDTPVCYLQDSHTVEIVKIVRDFIKEYKISVYNEETHKGLVRHILTRIGRNSGEIMVCLVINGTYLPHQEILVDRLRQVLGMVSVVLNENKARTNVILGEKITVLWGKDTIQDTIGAIAFEISPLSFYQVNPLQTEVLYQKALDLADLSGKETVLDLYCGIGTISLFFAKKAKRVFGVEIVPRAIADAKRNADINQITNATFAVGAAEEVIPKLYEEEGIQADIIVVDPPRKGCDKKLLETILKIAPDKVIYISCDPATLARDLGFLCEGEEAYQLKALQVVDQFPMTTHVETVCLLSKLKSNHHIEVNLNMDELDLTSAESKATHEEIKEYVLENSGFKVSSLYIGQVKEKMGIKERENYNISKKEDAKVPQCPADKEKAIIEAFKHFNMID